MPEFEAIKNEKDPVARQTMVAKLCAILFDRYCPDVEFIISMYHDRILSSVTCYEDPVDMMALLSANKFAILARETRGDEAGKEFEDPKEAANYAAQVKSSHKEDKDG